MWRSAGHPDQLAQARPSKPDKLNYTVYFLFIAFPAGACQVESRHAKTRDEEIVMAKNKSPKRGRPPKDLAGDVQARILDAAQQLFLEKGFRSASIDDISELAPASKPTIYAHFPGKEALFVAVVARTINGLTDFEGFTPAGRTIQEKLANLGIEIVERFVEDTLDLTRATIAEARRFPELSRNVHDAARDRAAGAVSQLLNEATQRVARSAKGPFSAKRSVATAQMFMDLILLPMLMRSLMGEELKDLKKELPTFLHERVNFFLAACEADWRP
jgi:AcrR family transcriptional regulator